MNTLTGNCCCFFCGLFIVVAGVNKVGVVEKMFVPLKDFFGVSIWQQLGVFSAVSILFSNLVSNVPFVLIAAHWVEAFAAPKTMWLALAMASTFAGNFTVVGSVANMIVMELSRDHVRVPFWTFFKIGAPLTLLATLIGIVILGIYSAGCWMLDAGCLILDAKNCPASSIKDPEIHCFF